MLHEVADVPLACYVFCNCNAEHPMWLTSSLRFSFLQWVHTLPEDTILKQSLIITKLYFIWFIFEYFRSCKWIYQLEIVFSKSFLEICFRTLPLYVIYSLSISLFIENNAEVKCIFEKIFWSSPNCILYDSFLSIYFVFLSSSFR